MTSGRPVVLQLSEKEVPVRTSAAQVAQEHELQAPADESVQLLPSVTWLDEQRPLLSQVSGLVHSVSLLLPHDAPTSMVFWQTVLTQVSAVQTSPSSHCELTVHSSVALHTKSVSSTSP